MVDVVKRWKPYRHCRENDDKGILFIRNAKAELSF